MGLLDGVGFLLWITNTKPSSQQTEQNMIVDLHPRKIVYNQPTWETNKKRTETDAGSVGFLHILFFPFFSKDSKEKTRMKGNLKKSEGEVVPTH